MIAGNRKYPEHGFCGSYFLDFSDELQRSGENDGKWLVAGDVAGVFLLLAEV